jgi:hypothetical protein
MKKSLLKLALHTANKMLYKHPQFNHYIHFAFLVQNEKIISIGKNHLGIPPKHLGYHKRINDVPKTHAEWDAYKKGKGLLDKSKPFECINIRLNKKGELKLSKPCCCCYDVLKELGCKKFYYSWDNGWLNN